MLMRLATCNAITASKLPTLSVTSNKNSRIANSLLFLQPNTQRTSIVSKNWQLQKLFCVCVM